MGSAGAAEQAVGSDGAAEQMKWAGEEPDPVAEGDAATAPGGAVQFCYLTTTGRRTGRAHTIEIWFGEDAGRHGSAESRSASAFGSGAVFTLPPRRRR
jgi:hypothetical protein